VRSNPDARGFIYKESMKTRIIHTRFWQDGFVLELNVCAKLLFIYVLTNERIGLTGGYECPDKFILLETGLSPDQLKQAKDRLKEKVIFKDGWIGIKNAVKYNNYSSNKIHQSAYERELKSIPEFVRDFILVSDYSPTSPRLDKNKNTEIINKKQEYINNKSKLIKDKSI
jgi:hypothetical protein